MKNYFLGFLTLLLFSCSTDVIIDAPYQKVPVVQSFLSISDTLHWVKITKLFSGAGSVSESAMIPDSSYFESIDASVIESVNGTDTRTFTLLDTTVSGREAGYFYYPEQKMYYFLCSDLRLDASYRISADIDENDLTVFSPSPTEGIMLVSESTINTRPTTPNVSLYSTVNGQDSYKTVTFEWSQISTPAEAELYSITTTFNYEEYYLNGSSEMKSLVISTGNNDPISNPGTATDYIMNGSTFYNAINNGISNDNTNILKRVFRTINCEVVAADEYLRTLYDIQQPSNGISQIKPNFSNILYFNNEIDPSELRAGRGVFASRSRFDFDFFRLSSSSMEHLCEGSLTSDLLFCSDDPFYDTKSYYCP
jgi:hypothetical protein